MTKRKTKAVKKDQSENDSLYVLKLILLIFLGSMWLRVTVDGELWLVPIPVGFLFGLLLVRRDHFQIDRKIEYALLTATMFVSYFLPFGILLAL